jgi:23S rRNA pseudouridine1911/1915/1917 synthase
MEKKAIVVQSSEAGQRVDTFLAEKTGITRSRIQKLIDGSNVLVNDGVARQNYRVKEKDLISFGAPRVENSILLPEPLPIEILFEDDYLVVVDKPAGMVIYPAAGHSGGTLMNGLAFHCAKLAAVGGPLRPGVVHRLDKDTSGVMVVALEDSAYYNLVEQFRERTMRREYVAIVYGDLKPDEGEIALPIGRSESERKKMSTRVKKGKHAVTRWKVIRRFGSATLIEARLGTGRTHQIRVHFASIGHPVIGDRTYGRKTSVEAGKRKIAVPRQMLHAGLLGFTHPATGEYREYSSPLPGDMKDMITLLSAAISSH